MRNAALTVPRRWRAARSLRNPGFRMLWLSLLPGTLGMMMAIVAFGYVAYDLSGSATTLGLVNAGWGVPMFVLSPIAGLVADRFPRTSVLLATQAFIGLTAAAAALLVLTGAIAVWHLVALTLAQGVGFAFNMPARQALIAELVDPPDLANALALSNAGLNANRVAGPAAAGVLLSLPGVGAGGVFAIMAALYGLVLILLWRVRDIAPSRPHVLAVRTFTFAQVTEGLRYTARQPALRALLVLAFLPLLFGMPYQALMPAVAAEVFRVDAAGLGALLTANGLGALGGSLLLATLGGGIGRLERIQRVAGVVFGGALAAFALAGRFAPALPLIAVAGGTSALYTAVNNTLLMSLTPRDYHGRVMGVYMMTFAAMPLSSLPAAWIADQLGLVPTLAGCGALSGAVVLALTVRRRTAAPAAGDARVAEGREISVR